MSRSDKSCGMEFADETSRRQWLKLMSVVGVGGLAGCGGDGAATDTPDENGGSPSNGDGANEYSVIMQPNHDLTNAGFNFFNGGTARPFFGHYYVTEHLAKLNPETTEYLPRIVGDWEVTEETLTLELSGNYFFQTGDPVTAKDIATEVWLSIIWGYQSDDMMVTANVIEEGPEGVVEFPLEAQLNPSLVMEEVLTTPFQRPAEFFWDIIKDWTPDMSGDELESLQDEVSAVEGPPGEWLHCGPFYPVEMTDQAMLLEKNPHHPHADELNFDRLRGVRVEDASVAQSLLQAGQVDAYEGNFSNSFVQGVPDQYEAWSVPAPRGGSALWFLHTHEYWQRLNLRKALNFVLDPGQISEAIDFDAFVPEHHTGMTTEISEAWIDSGTLDQFESYDQDFDRAQSLIEEEGFSREQDGDNYTVFTPDGNPWSVEIPLASTSPVNLDMGTIMIEQLGQFGINASVRAMDSTTWFNQFSNSEFPLTIFTFGDNGFEHPYYDLQVIYRPDGSEERHNNLPFEMDVPMPVGDHDGSLETVNMFDKITGLTRATSEEEERQLVTEIAWIWNTYVPAIPLAAIPTRNFVAVDRWEYGMDQDEFRRTRNDRRVPHTLMEEGLVQAK